MARSRRSSNASNKSSAVDGGEQELGSMYDYLAKVILLGPSGCGKSCILHRLVKDEWRLLSSQTIGVEFSSKILKVGTGSRRKRIKLQLWDTAGTERFRSVSRSYYRGAAGAILVYDVTSRSSFSALGTFLNDARALASPDLTIVMAGNKADLVENSVSGVDRDSEHSEDSGKRDMIGHAGSGQPNARYGQGSRQSATVTSHERVISAEEAANWASKTEVPVAVEISAYTGSGVAEAFHRLASIILTKIELGEIDPGDPTSGIQYGDTMSWDDGSSVLSRNNTIDDGGTRRRRKDRGVRGALGMHEWDSVFRTDRRRGHRRQNGCC